MFNLKFATVAWTAIAFFSGCSQSVKDTGVDLSAQARAAAEASGYVPPSGGERGELHIYTWCDYIAPDVLASFEKALGVRIIVDTFDSNEAMYAKLKAGGSGYDIMMPSSYQVAQMAKDGLIEKLDHARIPNVRKNFDKSFAMQIIDSDFTYNVPYAVTYTGFMYQKDKIPAGADVASWTILGNPALKSRITFLDDIREVIGAGLMFNGHSVNSTNPKEIDAAVEQVLKWKVNSRKFDGESYKTEVANGSSWLGHGYSTDATQVIVGDEEEGLSPREDIGFALPKEGFSIAFDEMVVAKNAPRLDLAYAFINYVYDGEVAKVNMDFICGPSPVKPGIDLLDPDYRALIILDSKTIVRGQVIKGFDEKPEVQELYNKAWDRIKATDAR